MTTVVSNSPLETERIAANLSCGFVGGECIALEGELGAGKTRFVRGLLMGLGGDAREVSSPTFVLLNIYTTGRLPVYHIDAYRIGSDDLENLGFAELLQQGAIVVIEWASKVRSLLPAGRVEVTIAHVAQEQREICVDPA